MRSSPGRDSNPLPPDCKSGKIYHTATSAPEPRLPKGFPLFSALRMASPDTVILLIVDYHAATGGQDASGPLALSCIHRWERISLEPDRSSAVVHSSLACRCTTNSSDGRYKFGPLLQRCFCLQRPKRDSHNITHIIVAVAKALGGSFKLVTLAPKTKGDDSTAQGNTVAIQTN